MFSSLSLTKGDTLHYVEQLSSHRKFHLLYTDFKKLLTTATRCGNFYFLCLLCSNTEVCYSTTPDLLIIGCNQ
jgi:hypothetical protein